ncbi:MAG: PAS domain S-box protein [Bacteroidales bacterium]
MKSVKKINNPEQLISDSLNSIGELKYCGEKLSVLINNSFDPILIFENFKVIDCNQAALTLLKIASKEDLLSADFVKFSPEKQPDGKSSKLKAKKMIDLVLKSGKHHFEWLYRSSDNNDVFVDVELISVTDKNKTIIFSIWHDKSKQKEIESAISDSEQKYRDLFNQAADGILVGIKNGEIINANDSILKLSGYTREELIGKNISFLFEKEDLSSNPLRYDLVKKGDTVICERKIIRKDGDRIYVEMNTKILGDGRMQALIRDISRRKEAEIELKKNRELLQKAENIAGLGRFIYHIKYDTWESSAILNKILGIDSDYKKDLGSWLCLIHPDFQDEMKEYFMTNILKNREPFNKVYKVVRKIDQQERWVQGMAEMECDANNNPVLIFGTIQDITDRKNTETAIKESEEKYRLLAENTLDIIFKLDIRIGEFKYINPACERILGFTPEEFYNTPLLESEFMHPDSRVNFEEAFANLKKGIAPESFEFKVFDKNRNEKWISQRNTIIFDDLKNPLFLLGVATDVTEKKITELELKDSEEKYKNIFFNAPLGVMHYAESGTITDCNQQFVNILGSSRELLIGLNMINDLDNAKMTRSVKKSFSLGESYFEDWYTSVTGKKKTFVRVLFKTTLNSKTNKVVGVCLVEDFTERQKSKELIKEKEEKFRRLFESAIDSIFLLKDGVFIDCNHKTLEMFGCKQEDIIGKSPGFFSPEVQPDGSNSMEKSIEIINASQKGHIETFGWVHRKLDGTTFYTEVSLNSFKVGNEILVQAIVRDVTEKTRIFEQLKISEDKFLKIFNFTPDAIILTDIITGKVYDINKGCTDIMGFTKEDALGKSTVELNIWVNDVDRENYIEMLKKGTVRNHEIDFRTKSGKIITTLISADIINIDNEPYVLGIVRNISERKATEQKLKLSEQKNRDIFNSTNDIIFILNDKGNVIDVNKAITEELGIDINNAIGMPFENLITEEYKQELKKKISLINKGTEISFIEVEAYNKNHEKVNFEVYSKSIDYENEKAILTVARNIDDRKKLENKLINTVIETEEKERQRLASDLHDEVGPLLSSMKMYINILSSSKDELKSKYIIEQLNLLIEESIHNIREVSAALNPYLLNKYGLKTAIETFFEKSKSLIAIQFATNIENNRFPINIETVYYRVVKELFNNTIKHANATNVEIELSYIESLLILKYSDNGKGFIFDDKVSDKKKNMGLRNIMNRIKMINGKYIVNSDKKKGFGFELITKCVIIELEK